MEGSGSKATVLENRMQNFKKGFDGDDRKKMTPGRLRMLCEVEWPSVGVGRPSEGTMDLNVIKAVYGIVTGKRGHPDQFLYIDSWLGIAQEPPTPPTAPPQIVPFLCLWRGRKNLDGPKGNQG